ncbi:MAG TPA: hypothetical protein VM536_06750 [Chloroflexia bacterium]|nr:hypothetical protein [Chloroflexia bacterium]
MRRFSLLLLLLLFPLTAGAQAGSRTFPETGKTVRGSFLQYWNTHGGLPQQGFPIAEEMQEKSDLNGQTYTVQYFERAVFEKHPENKPPFDILLSQLGTFRYNAKYRSGAPGEQASTLNPRTFSETGKTIGGRFRAYWEGHGGLAQQGFPITNEFTETSELNGRPYLVQYFERAVFEYHPEYEGTEYEVLLSQLGTLQYHRKYPTAGGPTGAVIDLQDQCLLGGVMNGVWSSDNVIATTLKGGESYRLYSLATALGHGSGTAPESVGAPCEDTLQVTVAPTPAAATLAVGGTWNPQPRRPEVLNPDQAVYRDAAAAVLRAHGITNPQVHLTQLVRVDLEGDGTPEVLVTATYYQDGVAPHATVGDYSVVFLRKVIGGQVQTMLLDGDFYTEGIPFGAPMTYAITGILDLNGDGTLEVAVRYQYYEGAGTGVYQIKGTQVEIVLSCGCGA